MTGGVDELRRATAATWPAIVVEPLGDWVLRSSHGYTGRANSVLVNGDPGLPIAAAADAVVAFYRRHGQSPLAQVVIGAPEDAVLRSAGWADARPTEADCWVMSRPVAGFAGGGGEVDGVRLGPLDGAWLATRFPDGVPPGARAVLEGSGHVVFGSVRDTAGQLVGLGRGAVADGHVGVTALWVAESRRREGIGSRLLSTLVGWGRGHDATTAFLEVLDDNLLARQVYHRAGFVDRYRYRYLTVGPS